MKLKFVELLLCVALGGGAQGRIYLVPTPGPGSQLNFAMTGGAWVQRSYTVADAQGGWRHTVYLKMPCNSTAAFAGHVAVNYCQILPEIVKQ